MPAENRSDRAPYRPDIDGLRAVAVLLVLIFHAFPKLIPGGFIGVDVFFVISGFLITDIIVSKNFSFAGFYARRARRLFPALTLVLCGSMIAGWHLMTPAQFEELGRQTIASVLFVPNWLFWSETGYFDAAAHTKPLLHLWSLGVEEQFYLVGPALLIAAARFSIRPFWVLLVATTLSLLCCVYFSRIHPSPAFSFYLPFSRAWEISAGGLLALVKLPRRQSTMSTAGFSVGLCAIVLSSFFINGDSGWPGLATLVIVAGSMFSIYFGATSKFAQQTLGSAPVVFLGKISYPLYLWHWPILTFLYLNTGAPLSPLQASTALLVSIVLAAFTYLVVEEPLKSRISLRPLAWSASSVLFLVGLSGFAVILQRGIPSRLPASLQRALAYEQYDFKSDAYNPGCWLGNNEPTSELLPVCLKTKRKDAIAVWGDSHAARLSPGLREVFGANRISQLTRNGCAPLLDLPSPPASGTECRNGNNQILSILRDHRPETVILLGAWQNYTTDWRESSDFSKMLRNTINQLKEAGINNVILVGPAPRFEPTLPTVIVRDWSRHQWESLPDRIQIPMPDTIRMDQDLARIASIEGVRYVSLLKTFCTSDGCLIKKPGSDSDLVSWDYGHLTTTGAIIAAQNIKDDKTTASGQTEY